MHTSLEALRELAFTDVHWWSLVTRAVIVFCAVLLLLRIAGKRAIANMGMSEFVALLLISNSVQNAMNGGDNSLVGGILLASVIIIMSRAFQYATFRWRRVERLVQGTPTLLIHHGKILHDHLKRELLTVRELRTLLRKQGIHDLSEVAEAVLESDGYVSVTRKSELGTDMEMVRNDVY
jgi:uncharacterized membrane protein YcaP (DUF421 family)